MLAVVSLLMLRLTNGSGTSDTNDTINPVLQKEIEEQKVLPDDDYSISIQAFQNLSTNDNVLSTSTMDEMKDPDAEHAHLSENEQKIKMQKDFLKKLNDLAMTKSTDAKKDAVQVKFEEAPRVLPILNDVGELIAGLEAVKMRPSPSPKSTSKRDAKKKNIIQAKPVKDHLTKELTTKKADKLIPKNSETKKNVIKEEIGEENLLWDKKRSESIASTLSMSNSSLCVDFPEVKDFYSEENTGEDTDDEREDDEQESRNIVDQTEKKNVITPR